MEQEQFDTMQLAMSTVASMAVRGQLAISREMPNAAGFYDAEGVHVCVSFVPTSERAMMAYLSAALADAPAPMGAWWAWLVEGSSGTNLEGDTVFDEKGAYIIMAMARGSDAVGQYVYPISPEFSHWHIISPADTYDAANRTIIRILKGALRIAHTLQEDDDESGGTPTGDSSGV